MYLFRHDDHHRHRHRHIAYKIVETFMFGVCDLMMNMFQCFRLICLLPFCNNMKMKNIININTCSIAYLDGFNATNAFVWEMGTINGFRPFFRNLIAFFNRIDAAIAFIFMGWCCCCCGCCCFFNYVFIYVCSVRYAPASTIFLLNAKYYFAQMGCD